tara:strand:+ start:3602 stop:5350 length:1749 start_codon:yes stop_codon:yes gene_type:complete
MNTSKIYIFIDNEQDYLFYRKKYHGKNTCWVSSSPYLINKIKDNNDLIINYENYLSSKIINHLMPLSHKLSESIINNTYKNLTFLTQKETQLIFYRDLSVMIGSFLYKYYALYCFLIDNQKASEFIFIGKKIFKTDLNHPNNFYDDVIYDLAKNLNLNNFKFLNSVYKSKEKISLKNNILIKIVSILNLNINRILFKVYKVLPLRFFFKNKKNVFIFQEVYNFENNFIKLFRKFNINFINFKFEKFKLKKKFNISKIQIKKIDNVLKDWIKNKKYLSKINFKPAIETILMHHFQIINNFKFNRTEINRKLENCSKKIRSNDLILSNTLERPLHLYLYLKLKKKTKFAFFEHGQTSGYHKGWNLRKKTQTINLGNFAFFAHQHSLNVQKKNIPKNTISKVLGGSKFYFSKKNFLLKNLVKIILGVPILKKNVVYVAELFRNNSTFGPFIGRDLDILKDTKNITNYISKKNKNSFKILKTYPSSLYKDDFKFEDTANFKILTMYNWMYIYYIFDEIYFSTIQSTWLYKNRYQKVNLINRNVSPINVKYIKKIKKISSKKNGFEVYRLIDEKVAVDDGSWIKILN